MPKNQLLHLNTPDEWEPLPPKAARPLGGRFFDSAFILGEQGRASGRLCVLVLLSGTLQESLHVPPVSLSTLQRLIQHEPFSRFNNPELSSS